MTNYLISKNVAVLGGGQVGSTLAKAILESGKAKGVVIAARDPEKTKAKLLEQGIDSLSVELSSSAIASADIIILATPSLHSDEEIADVAMSMGDVNGKIIIDSTNPVSGFSDGLQIRWKQGTSGGEVFQNALPSAFVFKAFNTIGVEHMACAEGKDMFFCGSSTSEESLETVREVISAVGFNPIYVGPIRYARNLEAMAELWIHCAIPPLPAANLGRDWSFAVARHKTSL
jgi:8-hydroxy-5-deazaflavin:NADPH oxidoreductase